MLRKIVIGMLLTGLFFVAQGAPTTLKGHVRDVAFHLVLLHQAQDYLSWDRNTVAMAYTDATGAFEMTFELADTAQLLLTWGTTHKWPVTMVPGGQYTYTFSPEDGTSQPEGVLPEFEGRIAAIRAQCAQARLLAEQSPENGFATFYAEMEKLYARETATDNPWLRTWARYHIGYNLIEAASRMRDKLRVDSLEMTLLVKQPPQPDHPEYVQFLYFMTLNKISVPFLRHFFTHPTRDYGLPIEIMKREVTWYPGRELRTLVMLMSFKVCFANHLYKTKADLEKELQGMTAVLDDDQKRIAMRLLHRFHRQPRRLLQGHHLYNAAGEALAPEALRGQYVWYRIRMEGCPISAPSACIDAALPLALEAKVRVVHIGKAPGTGVFGPRTADQLPLLRNHLGLDCAADVLVDWEGRVLVY